VADFPVTRAGAILAVSDFGTSLRFYRDRVITHRLPLSEAAEAYRLFDSRAATKVVLLP